MSEAAASKQPAQRRWTPGATLWFMWMVGMWVSFYILLFADKLEGLWSTIRDLPLLVEIVLWLPFFPWMLGMAVWTSSWSEWLRGTLVACFTIGWSLAFLPRRK